MTSFVSCPTHLAYVFFTVGSGVLILFLIPLLDPMQGQSRDEIPL